MLGSKMKCFLINTNFTSRNLHTVLKNNTFISGVHRDTLAALQSSSFMKNQNITSKLQVVNYSFLSPLNDKTAGYENKHGDKCNSFTSRTHTCGELRSRNVGEKVTLCGWVQYLRLSKFILIRDGYGFVQCVVGDKEIDFNQIPLESIVKVHGEVLLRPENMNNPDMETGEIEVVIQHLEILNIADKVPFNLRNYQKPNEQLRLQYRYVDLRFPQMQHNLRQRSLMLHNMRRFLVEKCAFVEVETPTLFCRTPGGAREFVVPTHHKDMYYSLVQSPQQFKQMLMAGAIDKYFQIARCYRDETSRPDRQPEFTQLDIELSFTNREGVLTLMEQLLYDTYLKDLPRPPFKRMTYKHALENYGTDKPNLAYDMKLVNISEMISKGSNNSAYLISYSNKLSKFTTKTKESIRQLGKKYKTNIILNDNIGKVYGVDVSNRIKEKIPSEESTIICTGQNDNACLCLGEIRRLIAELLVKEKLLHIKENIDPLWVVDFPLFLQGENGELETCHHPFTAPHPDDMYLLESDPLKVRSLAYDLVMNGNEVGGGSVRIHSWEMQVKVFNMLNIECKDMEHFLNALRTGCPPHAGIALGLDRLMTIACNADSIRDVIAFPKSHEGKDPLSGAPNSISNEDKKYYHLK